MKKIILPVLIICLFVACKSKSKSPVDDSVTTSVYAKDQSEELIKKFKPIIQGEWVKADYVDKVIKTKSPLAAADEATGLTAMYINTDNIKGDSIVFIAGYGNHDSADCTIKFQQGKSPSTIIFNGGDLSYSVENGDTTITVPVYDNNKKQTVGTKYIRVLKKQPENDLGYGLYHYINKVLVAGNYTLIDSGGVTSKVHFSEEGKVNGFLNCKTYMINIDLNSDANDNLDGIYFKTAKKENRNFTFKINADTLNLYDTYENADSTELVLGKLKYKLVRQK